MCVTSVGVPQPDDGARHVAALVLMGVTEGAIYWHLKQIYQKLPISRQVDLVRLVLSIAQVRVTAARRTVSL